MNEIDYSFLNDVKNRFLPLPRSAVEGLEHEPKQSDFEFIEELGEGTFGTVYLASHKKTKAKYAIKSIDKSEPENLAEKKNFNREVEIMYKLNHPNIVKLYGHFEDEKYCYFIMQYIPKRSVFELIPQRGEKPNIKLIASVMKDLLKAVYYLHNMKPTIIHRDIKPENVLLDENSKAYLTDFGWSTYMINYERRHTCCGTPLYLPPEMVGDFGHDETADIWCIGVLLFELMTGQTPFEGNDIDTVKYNISKLNIAWPPYMDPDAKDLISKILKLNGKDRLPIEDILKHKFFSQFFPNAVKELTKPENQKNKIFVVSVDDPKKWGHNENKPPKKKTKFNLTNLNEHVYRNNNVFNSNRNNVINNENSSNNNAKNIKENDIQRRMERTRTTYVPFAKIDLSNYDKKRTINSNKNVTNYNDTGLAIIKNSNNKSNDKILNNSNSVNNKNYTRLNNYNNNTNIVNNRRKIKSNNNLQIYSNTNNNYNNKRKNYIHISTYSNLNKDFSQRNENKNPFNLSNMSKDFNNSNYQNNNNYVVNNYRNSYNNNHTIFYIKIKFIHNFLSINFRR